MRKYLLHVLLMSGFLGLAQEYVPKNDGVKTPDNGYVAFTGAKIFVRPGEIIEKGTLLIRKGKVVHVGNRVDIPENSVLVDLEGKTVYPSFIDVFSGFGIKMPPVPEQASRSSQYDSKRQGYYWNEHVMPETEAISRFEYDRAQAEKYLKVGFGLVNSHVQDGIVRGSGVLVALNNSGKDNERILDARSGQYLSFRKSRYSEQSYPTSLMGSMALLRQLYHDSAWYGQGGIEGTDLSLQALGRNRDLAQIFDAGDKSNALRADGIADAFGLSYTLVGGGDEYEQIEKIKQTQSVFVIPLNFPKPFDVEDQHTAQYLSLADMRNWNQAPSNPAVLSANGVEFALTAHGLEKIEDFQKNLRRAILYGLSEESALEALTTVPAKILKKTGQIGSLQPGAVASFMICDGNIFQESGRILEHWVQGEPYRISPLDSGNITGKYELSLDSSTYDLSISGSQESPTSSLRRNGKTLKSKASLKDNRFHLFFEKDSLSKNYVRLSARVNTKGTLEGVAHYPDGSKGEWKAIKVSGKTQASKQDQALPLSPVTYPNVAFGLESLPEQEDLLFQGATVWTNEADGILQETDVLVKDGKISKIGKGLKPGKARVIDARGKHLTSGIIDEHSHIATLSTNEAGQNSTAEVTMEDALNH